MKQNESMLKDRLLASYVKSTDSEDARVRALMNSKKPFYELGKVCGKEHLEDPSKLVKDVVHAELAKKVWGEFCRRQGEQYFEYDNIVKVMTGGEAALGEHVVELQNKFASGYLQAMTDFNMGYGTAVGKKASDVASEWYDFNVELFNAFWGWSGAAMPTVNNHANRFVEMLDNRDVDGMVKLYNAHGEKIEEKFPDAGKLVGFLRAIREK